VKAIKVTPAVEVGILHDRVSDKRVSLLVMLDEASITRMNAYDLSTFRLWLFSKEWRLLNKQLISVARAFDARGRFQPRRALVSRQGRQLYAAFEISPADWQAAHNLLITGGFLRGSEHSVDFEVVVSKSQVKPLKSPPALGQIRLPDPPTTGASRVAGAGGYSTVLRSAHGTLDGRWACGAMTNWLALAGSRQRVLLRATYSLAR